MIGSHGDKTFGKLDSMERKGNVHLQEMVGWTIRMNECMNDPVNCNPPKLMIGVSGHNSTFYTTRPETTWANEMNSVMNHAPDAGSIARR